MKKRPPPRLQPVAPPGLQIPIRLKLAPKPPDLHYAHRGAGGAVYTLGVGGNSIIVGYALGAAGAAQRGICKLTELTEEREARTRHYLDVLNTLRAAPPIPNILLPTAIYYDTQAMGAPPAELFLREGQAGAVGSAFLVELYDLCVPYRMTQDAKRYIEHTVVLIDALQAMHNLHIAHMDFKFENLMMRRRFSRSATHIGEMELVDSPIIIDLGEARLCDARGGALPLSTTKSLIVQNPTVLKMLRDPKGFDERHGPYEQISHAILQHPADFVYIDYLMFGIFLDRHAPRDTPQFKSIGRKLIFSSLYHLAHLVRLFGLANSADLFTPEAIALYAHEPLAFPQGGVVGAAAAHANPFAEARASLLRIHASILGA